MICKNYLEFCAIKLIYMYSKHLSCGDLFKSLSLIIHSLILCEIKPIGLKLPKFWTILLLLFKINLWWTQNMESIFFKLKGTVSVFLSDIQEGIPDSRQFLITFDWSRMHGQPQCIWISEPGQPFRSQFVLHRPDIGYIKQTLNRTSRCNKVDAVRL